MSLDRVRRVAIALQPELQQMMAAMQARIAGHDDFVFDKLAQSVLYTREGTVLWRARAELIGRFSQDLGLFRWWWVGKTTVGECKMDTAYGEAQRMELKAMMDKQVVVDGLEDARHLVGLAAHLAGADGIIEMDEAREGDDLKLAFYGLFDTWKGTTRTKSQTPFAVSRTMPPPEVRARTGSSPGISQIPPAPRVPSVSVPTPSVPMQPVGIREPAPTLLEGLVPSLWLALQAAGQMAFRQALLVISVDTTGEKARFFTQIVVQNDRGDLEAVDTTRPVLDAVAALIGEDARSGNGRWRRLAVRFWRNEKGSPAVERATVVA
jgi:hypothetical protein